MENVSNLYYRQDLVLLLFHFQNQKGFSDFNPVREAVSRRIECKYTVSRFEAEVILIWNI